MTTPLGGPIATGTSGVASTAPPKKAGDSAMGPDAFMKLLVAQLKYQNPMAPTDGQQYMTQMATFTQVEKLDQLVKAQVSALQWQQRVSAEGMVGRSVTGTTDGVVSTGTVTGVRYAGGTATLELSDGRTLDASLVERVEVVRTPTSPAPVAPPATPAPSTSTSTTTSSTTSTTTTGTTGSGTAGSDTSTTAPAAGTPSA